MVPSQVERRQASAPIGKSWEANKWVHFGKYITEVARKTPMMGRVAMDPKSEAPRRLPLVKVIESGKVETRRATPSSSART